MAGLARSRLIAEHVSSPHRREPGADALVARGGSGTMGELLTGIGSRAVRPPGMRSDSRIRSEVVAV